MLPGLPAYILFMMVRYTDHINNDAWVRSLIQGAIATIKKSVKKRGANDIEMNVMWLSNLLRFLNNMQQYSGEENFNKFSTPKQIEHCLRSFDLSEYRRVIRYEIMLFLKIFVRLKTNVFLFLKDFKECVLLKCYYIEFLAM